MRAAPEARTADTSRPRFEDGAIDLQELFRRMAKDVIERYRRVDRMAMAMVDEMHRTGTSTRKVQAVAEKLGTARISKDQVSAICGSLEADAAELLNRDSSGLDMPYLRLDAIYVKCRCDGRVASTAVVIAVGCDSEGWYHVPGLGVVDTEPYDSRLSFPRKVRGLLPRRGTRHGGGRAGRARISRLPTIPLEEAQDQHRPPIMLIVRALARAAHFSRAVQ